MSAIETVFSLSTSFCRALYREFARNHSTTQVKGDVGSVLAYEPSSTLRAIGRQSLSKERLRQHSLYRGGQVGDIARRDTQTCIVDRLE
jgi:hypothetical protein